MAESVGNVLARLTGTVFGMVTEMGIEMVLGRVLGTVTELEVMQRKTTFVHPMNPPHPPTGS